MHLWNTNPFAGISLAKGQGCTVWDDRGKPYLDLLSGTWCAALGYGHPRWTAAVQRLAGSLVHMGGAFHHAGLERGMAKLAEILPPRLDRAVFLSSGSEAVELALKMARAATGAHEFVVLEGCFYGSTNHALSLSEMGRTIDFLPSPGTVHRLPKPDCARCPMSADCDGSFPCLEKLEALPDHAIAAVLFEPVISGAGILVPPPGYAAKLRETCTRKGFPLLCNEVTTGLGRTGRWFGFEHDGIVPDLLIMGKILGAGLPVSAVATTQEIEAACGSKVLHLQSHQNDPFSGGLAAEVITILQEERLVEASEIIGHRLREGVSAMRLRKPAIKAVRGLGTMVGIELQPEVAPQGPAIVKRMLEKGFLISFQPAYRSFRLFPPFVLTESEMDSFLVNFEDALGAL
jgi:2,2-dialkylglycine decarboxylase (pyruvate)